MDVFEGLDNSIAERLNVYLRSMLYRFEVNMTSCDWDDLDVYEDEGMECVSKFVEFCIDENGRNAVWGTCTI